MRKIKIDIVRMYYPHREQDLYCMVYDQDNI